MYINKRMRKLSEIRLEFWITTAICGVWTVALWLLLIGKLATDDFLSFINHYTNWSWVINAAFFMLDIFSLFDKTRYMSMILGSSLFWLANASSWLVFWLVFIMLSDNPNIIIELSNQGGGKYPLGFILDMDRVFHVLPAIFILVYFVIRRKSVTRGVALVFYPTTSKAIKAIYVLYIIIFSATPLGLYNIFFNFVEIYGITTNVSVIYVMAIIITIIFNGVPFIYTIIYREHFLEYDAGGT